MNEEIKEGEKLINSFSGTLKADDGDVVNVSSNKITVCSSTGQIKFKITGTNVRNVLLVDGWFFYCIIDCSLSRETTAYTPDGEVDESNSFS